MDNVQNCDYIAEICLKINRTGQDTYSDRRRVKQVPCGSYNEEFSDLYRQTNVINTRPAWMTPSVNTSVKFLVIFDLLSFILNTLHRLDYISHFEWYLIS
jgi:hypothetical protein